MIKIDIDILSSPEKLQQFLASFKPEERTAALKLTLKYLVHLQTHPSTFNSPAFNFLLLVMNVSTAGTVGSCLWTLYFLLLSFLCNSYAFFSRSVDNSLWCGLGSVLVGVSNVMVLLNSGMPRHALRVPDQIVSGYGNVRDVIRVEKELFIGHVPQNHTQWVAPDALVDNDMINARGLVVFGQKKNVFGVSTLFTEAAITADFPDKGSRMLCIGQGLKTTDIVESIKTAKPYQKLTGAYGDRVSCTSWNPDNILNGAFIPDPKKVSSILPLKKTRELADKIQVSALSDEDLADTKEENELIDTIAADLKDAVSLQAVDVDGCKATETVVNFKDEDGEFKTTFFTTYDGCYGPAAKDQPDKL